MGAGCTSENNVIRASTSSLIDEDETTPYKILILGPSYAGKTYLLYSWMLGIDGVYSTKPTEEFNVETVKSKSGILFTMWDLSGNPTFRHFRKRKFYEGSQGIVFVYDASSKLIPAKEDLTLLLQERALQDVPLLIVANQLKEEDSMKDEALLEQLNTDMMSELSNRTWHLSRVRLKSQPDIDEVLCDLQRLVTL